MIEDVGTRFVTGADIQSLQTISRDCLRGGRCARDFSWLLKQPRVVGAVAATAYGKVVGYLIWRAYGRHSSNLLEAAVLPEYRRQGIATLLVRVHLLDRLRYTPERVLECAVDERFLDFQCFLRKLGFRAIGISRGTCLDSSDGGLHDEFHFEYRQPVAVQDPLEAGIWATEH